jgi:hypothetical protein
MDDTNIQEPSELEALTHLLTQSFRQSYELLAETGDEDDGFAPELAVQGATAVIVAVATVMSSPAPDPEPEDTAIDISAANAAEDTYVLTLPLGRLYIKAPPGSPELTLTWVVEHNHKAYTVRRTMDLNLQE